jgi:hypothetical protein
MSRREGGMKGLTKVAALLCGVTSVAGGVPRIGGNPAPQPGEPTLVATYGSLPLTFEANEGQVDQAVRFLVRGQGVTLFLTPAEAVLSLDGRSGKRAVVRLRLVGARKNARMVGLEPRPTRSHYFLGQNPARWHEGVRHYARVRAERVYPGVDLVYRGNRRQLEYDLVVLPGADPGRIRLAFAGAESIAIGSDGALIVRTAAGDLVQPRPVIYQEARQGRLRVQGRYVLLAPEASEAAPGGHPEVGFLVGSYDHHLPLVVDPVLVYATFLGGSGFDRGLGIAVDAAGNAYVTGSTASLIFPGVGGSSIDPVPNSAGNAFVTKIDASGTSIVYSTFLGGGGGDYGTAIAVDATGNAYVTGVTASATFPGVSGSSIQPAPGGGDDAFVTKVDASGASIVYSTFLGGSGNDAAMGIAVDGAGNAYVTGGTSSASFPGVAGSSIQPAYAGAGDAFVTKINAAGTAIAYSTFLGGVGDDVGRGIAVDRLGNAYVTGGSGSPSFPGVGGGSIQPANAGGLSDAFVTKINAAGTAIAYSTFLGGADDDGGGGIAVDAAGAAYVTGFTDSTSFAGVGGSSLQPASGGGRDAFVTKIDPSGGAIVYSTFLGGSGGDGGFGIAADGAGNAYVTGITTSTAFPGVTASSIQPGNGGGWDAFVTEINAAGSAIVYSTFLGGSGYDYGLGIAVDGVANAYVTGESSSASFPGVGGGSIQPANAGDGDAFVVKIGSAAEIPAVSRWALAALALALGGMTLARLRRRRGPDRPEA